ncbi:uncharacterized protein ACOB8E_006920 isoform 2-T3 [Sarcophilus harrisii]
MGKEDGIRGRRAQRSPFTKGSRESQPRGGRAPFALVQWEREKVGAAGRNGSEGLSFLSFLPMSGRGAASSAKGPYLPSLLPFLPSRDAFTSGCRGGARPRDSIRVLAAAGYPVRRSGEAAGAGGPRPGLQAVGPGLGPPLSPEQPIMMLQTGFPVIKSS